MLPLSLHASFEGFGSITPGGNQGGIVEVASLAESGPGTLREALTGKGHRRVVFKVGGTIKLQSALRIRGQSFITIDGSTAPSPGVTLEGHGLLIRGSHDIIISHIRVRNSNSDGITVKDGAYNIVIDHCSVANSRDENISVTEGAHDVTVSWCIIGDNRPNSFDLNTKGMLIANFNQPPVSNVSIHHNLFVNQSQRSPQISTPGLFDIRNNVIWHWDSYGIRIRDGAWGNIISNVFATSKNPGKAIILVSDGIRDAKPVYIQGNKGPEGLDANPLSTATSPFSIAPVSTDPAEAVKENVLKGVGAFPRDAVDALLAGKLVQK
jgi:pectate lyase